MLSAWGDESASNATADPGTYIIAAAIMFDDDVDNCRDAMGRLRLGTERKVHWRSDSPARHRHVVQVVRDLPVEGFVVVRNSTGEPPERCRRKCLERLVPQLHELSCQTLTLESRGSAPDRRDMRLVDALRRSRTISSAIKVDHLPGPKDPLCGLRTHCVGPLFHTGPAIRHICANSRRAPRSRSSTPDHIQTRREPRALSSGRNSRGSLPDLTAMGLAMPSLYRAAAGRQLSNCQAPAHH
jgi:hypothetical protein